jgi:integrase
MESAGSVEKKGLGIAAPGTVAALRVLLYKYVLFTGKSPATQRSIRSYVDRLAEAEGNKPVALLRPEHVQKRINVFANAGKASAARNLLCAIRLLMKLAVEVGWRKKGDDPTAGVELPKIKGKGYRTWIEDEAAAYEVAYLEGTRERLIYEAYACTALRRSDMARLGRQHLRQRKHVAVVGGYKVTHDLVLPDQHKTGEPLELPVLPWLQAAIDALPADQLMFFTAPNGSPLSGKRIADILAEACKAIGLGPKVCDASGKPKGLCGHGLRKRMAKRLAEEFGCSEFEIMSVLGHKDPRQARAYTAAASRKRMAENALFKVLRGKVPTSDSHTQVEGSHTEPKIGGKKGK